MKFSISQNGVVISSVYFNDNTIKEIVTFWTNVQYQSPQFALDLSPKTSSQLDQMYPNGLVPNISMSSEATFDVLSDSPIMGVINVIELQLNFIGAPDGSPQQWDTYFDNITEWAITPSNTAYVAPGTPSNQIILTPKNDQDQIEISYKILISFQLANDDKTYYAIIDPLAKVTSNTGSS